MAKLKKNQKPQNPGKETMTLFLQYSVVLLCVLIVTILPLAMKDGFYKIGEFKFQVYRVLMIGGMVFIVPELILYAIFTRKEFKLKECIKSLSVTDWFVIAYMILTLISFFANPKYMKDNFWGYPGWYMGLFSQFTFVFLYFIVSRFGDYYKIILAFLAGTSFITYVLGILNRLLIDPLGVYEGIDPKYYNFISTLGQHTWYSSFVCTFLPFVMGLYMVGKKRWLHILCGVFCVVGFMTVETQNADSAFFAMFGAFLVLFYVAVKEAVWMRRFMELGWGFLVAGKIFQGLLKMKPNEYLFTEGLEVKLGKISLFFITDNRSWILIGALTVIWALFFLLEKKNQYPVKAMGIFRIMVFVLIAVVLIAIVYIIVQGAKGRLPEQMMQKISGISYLVWNDSWGNWRGFTWRVTWKMITEFSPLHLLLGVGADGYARYGYEVYQDLIKSVWGDNVLTNAHNEWMTMIVDGGILGGITYLGIYVMGLTKGLRNAGSDQNIIPVGVAMAACIGSYFGHDLFCYQQVLCTPLVFVLMGMMSKYNSRGSN